MIVNARFLSQQITGVQRFAIELSKEIKKLYPSVVFVSPKDVLHKELAKELQVVFWGKYNGHLWEQVELPRFLMKMNFPVLINLSNTAPLAYRKNMLTIHDLAFHHHPEWFSKKFSIPYRLMLPVLSRKALHVFTVSEYSKKDIAKSFSIDLSKVSVIYNGVSSFFLSEDTSKNVTGNEKPFLLCVGSIDPRKNLERLLQAFSLVEKDVELLVVGGRSRVFANRSLEELVAKDPRVKLLGYISDNELKELYSSALAFIYPSLFEGFGIPPIEAQALGCPVVSSTATSLPEVLGDSALYCNPFDVKDISEKINFVINDSVLQRELRERGGRNILRYSWASSAKKVVEKAMEIS